MRDQICDAISKNRILEFDYRNQPRVVEPHLLGKSSKSNINLSAYQIGGRGNDIAVPDWGLYTLDKISNLRIAQETFTGTRPGYDGTDSRMVKIYCKL